MSKQFHHQKGRPTKQEEVVISEELQAYYEKGFSASYTSRATGFNIKTVSSRFNEWNKELLESGEGDFLNRCKVAREKTIISIEEEIESLNQQEQAIDNMIQSFKNKGDYDKVERFIKQKLRIIELKTKLQGDKINLISTPTFDTILEFDSKGMRYSN